MMAMKNNLEVFVMICKKCGNSFDDSFNNCPNCGENINAEKKAKKPIFKKWWFWLIIAAVLIIIIGSSAGGSEDELTSAGGNDTSVSVNASGTAEENTAEKEDNVYRVGSVLNDDGLEISYVSGEKWTGYNQYSAPQKGNIVVKLSFDVSNTASTDRYISSYDFTCYADGNAAEAYIWTEDTLSLTLSSGRKGSGSVFFEVPSDAEKIEVEYEVNAWSDKKAIFIVELG